MLIDLHQDLYLYSKWPEIFPNVNQVSPGQIKDFKTKLIIASAFAGPNSESEYDVTELQMWQQALEYYENLSEQGFYLVKNWSDTTTPENKDKTGIIFHLEGIYQEVSSDELDDWYDKGLRSIGLTWAETSPYAGGNKYSEVGLSNAGREVIEWCLDKDVLIDLAHMSERAFNETAEILEQANKPLIVSHANARAMCENGVDRNLSDGQLRRVAKSGGVVGIMFARSFVSGDQPADINTVISHIKHIVNITGPDSIAIGSDFGGLLSDPMVAGLKQFSDLENLKAIIVKEFGTNFTEKLFYKNAHRVLVSYLT